MKIIVFHDPASLIDPECNIAFQRLGHHVKTITLERNPEDPEKTLPDNILKKVTEILLFMPELLFMINGNGIDKTGLIPRIAAILKIPLALWYVDRPYSLENWGPDHMMPTTAIFATDRVYVNELKSESFDRVCFLPLATNPERFSERDKIYEDKPMDVVFVGKLERDKADAYLNALIDYWHDRPENFEHLYWKIVHAYSKRPNLSLAEIVTKVASEHEIVLKFPSREVKNLFYNSIEYKANVYHKTEVIKTLRPYGITVCGGWEWLDVVDKRHYLNEVNYFTGLAALYKSALINLNISKLQVKTGINQRLFDVPSAGGFLITDYREDVEEFFEPGKDVICYKSLEELKSHIRYYLLHPAEREKIVLAAREKVIRNHTYEVRMRELTEWIKTCMSDSEYSEEINKAIRRDHQYTEALNLLGAASWEIGQNSLALEFFKLGVSLDPYNTGAKRGIETINRVINRTRKIPA